MVAVAMRKKNYPKNTRSYWLLTFILLVLAAYYGFTQYQKLAGAQDALANEQDQITSVQNSATDAGNQYSDLKKAFDEKYKNVLDAIQNVFPPEENYTNLAILFDQFSSANNTTTNPFFMSDLKFGQSRVDASKDYIVLPVTMTIIASEANFMKFLQFIENSGSLDDKSRLMDIRSISINFSTQANQAATLPGQAGMAKQAAPTINVSISLNAYFQKSALNQGKTAATS